MSKPVHPTDGTPRPKRAELIELIWQRRLEQLRAFHARFGHYNVPGRWPDAPGLADWARQVRYKGQHGLLPEARMTALREIGFEFPVPGSKREEHWRKRVEELRAFRAEHGSFVRLAAINMSLANWFNLERVRWREGRLSATQIRDLEAVGVAPESAFDLQFERMFARLERYRERFGHCDVPTTWPEDPSLGAWVVTVRRKCREGVLSEDREERLHALGLEIDPLETEWLRCFEALRVFQQRFGHCRIPRSWKESPRLAAWVANQRRLQHRGELRADRKELLDGLGIEWNMWEDLWEIGRAHV